MTDEEKRQRELEKTLKLLNALSGPIYTFRTWNAQVGRNGRDVALDRAAAKIRAAVIEYMECKDPCP